jgi:hypothetical protein
MDWELLREMGIQNDGSLSGIEYAQGCVDVYEETTRAMGLLFPETTSQAVESSRLVYHNPPDAGSTYDHTYVQQDD